MLVHVVQLPLANSKPHILPLSSFLISMEAAFFAVYL